MDGLRFVLPCLVVFAGCSDSPTDMGMDDMSMSAEEVKINGRTTGSIQIPSLCERVAVDTRVTNGGADSFSFLWDVDHYEVAYADTSSGDIRVVRLSPEGVVIDTAYVVETTPGASTLPSIVATKTGYAVAWQEDGADHAVWAHALDLAGRPVGGSHVIATGRSGQTRPVLAASPHGTAISWMDQAPLDASVGKDIGTSVTHLGYLDTDLHLGTTVPARTVPSSGSSAYPWLAGNGSQLALLWSDNRAGQTDTYFASVDAQLGLPAPLDVRGPNGLNAALLGRLTLTDVGYLAAWEDLRSGDEEIYMSLLDPSGKRYAGGLVEEPDTGNANWPHVAWTGSAAGVAYYQFRAGKPQIFVTFIDQNGARIGGAADAQVSNTTVWARYPDVVWTGSVFGVMWVDARAGQPELYFNRAACERPAPI